jgi:hypothetical protein
MYLIDDIVIYTPHEDHKIDQSIQERTYKREGVVRAILETIHGEMFYNVEITVPRSSNGTLLLVSIPDSDLEFSGGVELTKEHYSYYYC